MVKGGQVSSNWNNAPQQGFINKTPFVILVRNANPKGIKDFDDLAKGGVEIINPDPMSSGGAQWSILAIYGSEIMKSEKAGNRDEGRTLKTLKAIWANVISTPGSAREAHARFER